MSLENGGPQFRVVDKNGYYPLIWEYHPENIPASVPQDFVVAKTPGMVDQYLMGRRKSVISNAIAFNILDSLGYSHLRTMSVITYPYEYESSGVEETPEWNVFVKDLMERFGLWSKISQSKFSKEIEIGIFPDLQCPVFVGYDTAEWAKTWGVEDINFSAIIDATIFVHEDQHVLQLRGGLPVNSLWAEQNAITKESELILSILNMNNKFTNKQESIVAYLLQCKSIRISNYRNGNGFKDHLVTDAYNSDGTPQKNHNLGKDDFVFGR